MALCEALAGVLYPTPPEFRWLQRLALALIGIAVVVLCLCMASIVVGLHFGISATCFATSLLSAFFAGSAGKSYCDPPNKQLQPTTIAAYDILESFAWRVN